MWPRDKQRTHPSRSSWPVSLNKRLILKRGGLEQEEKMLANLTSLIWGGENSTPAPGTTIASPESPEPLAKFNIRATTPADEEEADWVLVDRVASPSSQPASAEREESPMREDGVGEGDGQVVEAAAPRTGVTHRSPSLLQAIDVLRPAQKAQRRREERRLKRTPLERSNKARQVAAEGNKRAKRRDMMTPGKFSRAVNNRKC